VRERERERPVESGHDGFASEEAVFWDMVVVESDNASKVFLLLSAEITREKLQWC